MPALDPHEQARSEVFRIAVLWYAGTTTEPLTGTDAALATLRERGRRLLGGAAAPQPRSALLAERGETVAAERDLTRARELFAGLGATAAASATETELARIALIRGDLPDVPGAARRDRRSATSRRGSPPSWRCCGPRPPRQRALRGESLQALGEAQAVWKRSGRDDHGGRLEAIRLTLLAGDALGARALALQTQRSFAAQRRHVYARPRRRPGAGGRDRGRGRAPVRVCARAAAPPRPSPAPAGRQRRGAPS